MARSVHFTLNAIPADGRGSYANCFRGVHGTDGSIEETLCVKPKAKKRPQTQFFTHILQREMSHANNRSFREASASQNASTNIPREKLEKRLSCLLHKLKLSNGTKDSWFSNKTVKIIHDAFLLTTKGICSCNQMKQITVTWMLTSDLNHNAKNERNYIHQTWMIVHFPCQNRTSWWSDGKFAMRELHLRLTAEPFTTFPKQISHANFARIVTRMCYHTFYKADSKINIVPVQQQSSATASR